MDNRNIIFRDGTGRDGTGRDGTGRDGTGASYVEGLNVIIMLVTFTMD